MKRIVNSCDRCASAAVSVRRPYALQWMTYSCRRKWQRAVNRGHVVVGGRKPFLSSTHDRSRPINTWTSAVAVGHGISGPSQADCKPTPSSEDGRAERMVVALQRIDASTELTSRRRRYTRPT